MDPIERYEPGGGKQGTITAHPDAEYDIFVARLQYGILDNLSVGIGFPVVLRTFVDPVLGWIPGDYQPQIGRPYSEQDFWEWAADMGQGRPGTWTGNRGRLSDIVLGARLRWSDWFDAFDKAGVGASLSIYGAIPTGKPADPEEVAAVGTTMWDLSFQGQLSIHLSFDKTFKRELDDRLTLGLDVFYDVFFEQERTSPRGVKNPLLLNYAPYIGDTYTIDPGDFTGFSVRADVVPYRGPAWDTWITKGDVVMANRLPPIIALSVVYTFTHLQQSYWYSDYEPWDWDREKLWKPGYKNILVFGATFSFFRLGAPLQLYVTYRTSTLIPGKNTRAADAISVGLRLPLKFW
ncbi:MAG: hypothetical protein GXP54_02765 [Deltaproteobacteria bacterium]|nr:hypothetical protein [Deltaproteobacteria bacterium]